MKYTAIFIDPDSEVGYYTEYFISSHDQKVAWSDIEAHTPSGARLLFIIPGEQHVYSKADISLTEVA